MAISGSAQETNVFSFRQNTLEFSMTIISASLFAFDENNGVTTCIIRANERDEILCM